MTRSRLHHHGDRLESSLWSAFTTAGSLLITILTILVLFFGVFLSHTR
jgi:hypothetical protein